MIYEAAFKQRRGRALWWQRCSAEGPAEAAEKMTERANVNYRPGTWRLYAGPFEVKEDPIITNKQTNYAKV